MQADAFAQVIVLTIKSALAPVLAKLGETTGELVSLRERMTALEARPAVPGPPGADGQPGEKGLDGLGFDDLAVAFDGNHTIAFTFTRGTDVKSFPIVLPFLHWQGVFQHGSAYTVGDVVTHAGSAWHCQTPTTLPPRDGGPEWRLMVKRGRDGKDGRL